MSGVADVRCGGCRCGGCRTIFKLEGQARGSMNHLALLLPLLIFLPYFSFAEPYPFPSAFPSGSRPEVEQIRQLQKSLSEKETENRSLRERIKELESFGQRTEEACQCLPKPPNATGLVASKVEYRCQEAKGAGFSLQCSDVGDPWWGACHPYAWPTCNLSHDAFAHMPTFKAPLESDFASFPLPPSISTQYASVDPALLILASEGPIRLTSPTPDCTPPPPPPLEEFLVIGASLNLVDKQLLVACGGSKCFSWDMQHRGQWQFFADTRERREGHGAAAMKDGSGNVLLLGGHGSQFTAEIVPHGPLIPLQHSVFGSCLIHLVDQLIVTGGGTEYHHFVDRYDLTGKSRDLTGFIGPLPNMLQGRGGHACGSFTDANGDQVLIVTGGRTPDPNDIYSTMPIDTTELLFQAASSWTPGAALPRPLVGARAASLPLTLIVTGGQVDDDDDNDGEEDDPMDQIIRYLPNEERWEIQEWKLPLPSFNHALLPVDLDKLC